MQIKRVGAFAIKTGLALGLLVAASVGASAGPLDDPVSAILASPAATATGVTTVVSDGPNGFQIVTFISGGTAFNVVESSTPNSSTVSSTVSPPPPGSVNASYGAVADAGVEVFVNAPGVAEFPGLDPFFQRVLDSGFCSEELDNLEEANVSGNQSAIDEAQSRLDECIPKAEEQLRLAPAGFSLTSKTSPGIATIDGGVIAPASGKPAAVDDINARYTLANPKAKNPWVAFINTGLTGLDDDRSGADRRARIWNTQFGARMRWNPKTTVGIAGGYRRGKVTSKANGSKLKGDYLSATIFGDYLLKDALTLGLSTTYSRGSNTLKIGGGKGDFNVDIFGATAALTNVFDWQDLVVKPRLSAGIFEVRRQSYTDSNAVFVPGSNTTQGNVKFDTSFSKTYFNVDKFQSITPSLELGVGYFFREKFDANLTSGVTAKELGLGANIKTGVDMQLENGFSANFGGAYGVFENNIQVWSLRAELVKNF